MAPMLRDPRIGQYAVIAIQEPWRNPYYVTSHFPKETKDLFHLAMPETGVSEEWPRVCTYCQQRSQRDRDGIQHQGHNHPARPTKEGWTTNIHPQTYTLHRAATSQIEKEGTDMLIASLAATEAYEWRERTHYCRRLQHGGPPMGKGSTDQHQNKSVKGDHRHIPAIFSELHGT